ncbi:MAG: hypothetical protein OEQ47_16950 [Acidimicrobiia bacterium]|nr:hypothetical protein [Acidimicrobiia bacterium]
MRRLIAVVGLTTMTIMLAAPALAGTLEGDCRADKVSGDSFREDGSALDSKTVASATEATPFKIDPNGAVAWTAASEVPIENHTWRIGLVIGGIRTQFFDGGDPNSAKTQDGSGRVSIKERLEEVQFSQMSWVLDELNGKYEAWGDINGDEMASCVGTAWVEIDGSFGLFGLIGAGVAAAGGAMIVRAGVAKRT